jgi:hypothetical protein
VANDDFCTKQRSDTYVAAQNADFNNVNTLLKAKQMESRLLNSMALLDYVQ